MSESKSDYFVWYYDDNGDLARSMIFAWDPDDARDIFYMSGGKIDTIDKIELVPELK
jgi:hypothetical protein